MAAPPTSITLGQEVVELVVAPVPQEGLEHGVICRIHAETMHHRCDSSRSGKPQVTVRNGHQRTPGVTNGQEPTTETLSQGSSVDLLKHL